MGGGGINENKFVKVLYSHVLQIPNQQGRNDQCGKGKMLKGRKKLNENFEIKTMNTPSTISHWKEPGLFQEMEHSRAKNVFLGTFSVTRQQQSNQGLIG